MLIPNDVSITEAGGTEMTQYDLLKLQSAYGCTICGGSLSSSTGGSLDSTGSRKDSYCHWFLKTDNNKQVSLDISVFFQH